MLFSDFISTVYSRFGELRELSPSDQLQFSTEKREFKFIQLNALCYVDVDFNWKLTILIERKSYLSSLRRFKIIKLYKTI